MEKTPWYKVWYIWLSIPVIVIVLIAIIFISIRAFSSSQRALELRAEEFFHISLSDENILSAEIQVVDWHGFEILHAEIVIVAEKKEEVFRAYLQAARDTDVSYLPRHLVYRLPPEHEVDYFHQFFQSVQRGCIFISVVSQSVYIVFMQEQDGTILVILRCDFGGGQWRRYRR